MERQQLIASERDSNTAPKLGQRPDASGDDAATDEATDKQTAA